MSFDSRGDSVESYFLVDSMKEEDKLEWLNRVKDSLLDESQARTEAQRKYLKAYMGLDSTDEMIRSDYRDIDSHRRRRINKFRIPHLHDIVETKVSQMTRLKPDVEVLPTNDEFTDRGAAKVAKAVIGQIFEQQQLDHKLIEMHRHKGILGESYMFIDFNPNVGDLHPDYVAAKEAGIDYPKDLPKRLGDVEYTVELPWRVLLQRKEKMQDVEYYLRYKIMPKDEILAKYKKAGQVMEGIDDSGEMVFDISSMEETFLEDHVAVWEFCHKRTEQLPDGKRILFIGSVILEETDAPYSMDMFNFVRITDIDIPGYLNGVSKFHFALPIQKMYDDLSTLISKNIYLTAHAKWVLPTGSVRSMEQLGNDNTIIQYSGPIAPQLLQVAPNPNEVYGYRENIKNELQVMMGSHGISRGEVPKGVTAASAMVFLNELESERASSDISKHGNLVKEVARKSVAIAGDKYEMDDGRMVRIVGKNNTNLIKHFDTAVLSRPYDIRFGNSDGFPETKAARVERLMLMMQRNPSMFTSERWEQLLDVGNTERAIKLQTAAVESADSENEDMLAGVEVGSPEIFEDHIAHWRSHIKAMQSRSFKEEADNETYSYFLDHLADTELLMLEKAKTSPLFSAELANLKLFPITPAASKIASEQVASREQQEAMVQGQSNRGDEVTGSIPGVDTDGDN